MNYYSPSLMYCWLSELAASFSFRQCYSSFRFLHSFTRLISLLQLPVYQCFALLISVALLEIYLSCSEFGFWGNDVASEKIWLMRLPSI